MIPLSVWQARSDAQFLRIEVMNARLYWLGRCVQFTNPRDGEERLGLISEVTDDGFLVLEFQRVPGTDGTCEELVLPVGFESELFTVIEEVDNGTTEETLNSTTYTTHGS